MSSGSDVQVDDLLSTAPTFSGGAQDLTGALNDASTALQGLGSFWGNDKAGAQFAGTYQQVVAELLLMLAKLAEDIEGIAQGVTTMAASYGQTEADIVTMIRHGRTEETY
jgi:uncharacterized protein YukE